MVDVRTEVNEIMGVVKTFQEKKGISTVYCLFHECIRQTDIMENKNKMKENRTQIFQALCWPCCLSYLSPGPSAGCLWSEGQTGA